MALSFGYAMASGMKRLCLMPIAAAGLLAIAGCASDTANYPSLARRDVERVKTAPPPAGPPVAAPSPDASLPARLASLVADAREAHRRFGAARDRAERAVAAAAGAAVGSDAWATGSIALASLESARSQAMIALADLDALYANARITSSPDAAAIAAARDEVSGLVTEEDAVVIDLQRRSAAGGMGSPQ